MKTAIATTTTIPMLLRARLPGVLTMVIHTPPRLNKWLIDNAAPIFLRKTYVYQHFL